jgi:hypothetical protein
MKHSIQHHLLLIALSSFTLATRHSRAEASPEFMRALDAQLSTLEESLPAESLSSNTANTSAGPEERWFFKSFFVRSKVQFGIEVPELSKLIVAPELEVVLQRNDPTGWTSYKPK